MNRLFLLTYSLLLSITGFSQKTISGTVKDAVTSEPLIGAMIFCDDYGTTTDIDGYFELRISEECSITISYVGYEELVIKYPQEDADYWLNVAVNELDVMVITGSKFEQRLSESTVSVEVLKSSLLESTNTTRGDGLLNKLAGVQVVGGQANIRGGSGFSYGAGSRVMVLIDGLTALQPDAGYVNWADIPTESLDQIEVIKGAASALYGSSAMNGIVNFRRVKPTSTPVTKAFTSYTHYLDPEIAISKWWTTPPYTWAVGLSHAQKVGRLDVNAYGFYNDGESFNKESFETRGRVGLDLTYYLSDQWKVGINSLINYNKGQDFFLWDNDLRGLYKPFAGTLSAGERTRIMIDPKVEYIDNYSNRHKLLTRIYQINNINQFDRTNVSGNLYGEYQFHRQFDSLDLSMVGGVLAQKTNTDAELFGDTTFSFQNRAIYFQIDKKFDNLIVSAGTRYEYNFQQSPEEFESITIPRGKITDGGLVNRIGLNYGFSEYSSVRASWGQGYRFPTITERFIKTDFGGFFVFPNPLLQPERGWTAELGYKQGLQAGLFKGFADISIFSSRYFNMIEFSFLNDPYGFKPINVGDTEINGIELSLNGMLKLNKVDINLLGGYTYIDPRYLNFDRTEIRDNISTTQNVLKYRSKHSAKIDLEARWRFMKVGFSTQFYSHMINIDKRLETPLDGVDLLRIKAFRDRYNNGYRVIDLRIGATFGHFTLNFLVGNLINEVYTVRPGSLEAPRNLTLRVDYKI